MLLTEEFMVALPSPTFMVDQAVVPHPQLVVVPVGGAISLEADGNGTLTIVAGGVISANGGSVAIYLQMEVVVDPVDPFVCPVKVSPIMVLSVPKELLHSGGTGGGGEWHSITPLI